MRALYRAEVVGDERDRVLSELAADPKLEDTVRSYAVRLLQTVVENVELIDASLKEALTRWDLKRLAVIDRCVLRIGVAELLFESEVPARVILDEAIEIAKRYGSVESGRFVNGVLDHVARQSRSEEIS
jgi:N utilization substance protein B